MNPMADSKVKQDILAAVDSLKDELINLVSDAVKIPSVNPDYPGVVREKVIGGESRVNEYFKPIMESIALNTDMWEEERGRANLVGVYKGSHGGKSLIFNGHIDVVPPGANSEWTKAKPWSGRIADGKIWGRGACDMKGGDAAALIALKALLKAGYKPKGDVIIEYVVGEERMNTEAGTGATIKRGYKADAAIVMEPSSPPYRLGLCCVSPGVLYMDCTIRGKACHSSMRDELIRAGGAGAKVGVSSLDKAMIIYEGMKRLEEIWGQTKTHPLFARPGHFTIYPSAITGSLLGAPSIANETKMEYRIWHAPQDSDEQVKEEIEKQIAVFAQTDPWLRKNRPKVEWPFWWPPYDVPTDAPICKAIAAAYEAAIGEPVKYCGFAAVNDASFLNRAGIQTITLGPGCLYVAHASNEYVEIDELMDAAKVYALSIVEWCGV